MTATGRKQANKVLAGKLNVNVINLLVETQVSETSITLHGVTLNCEWCSGDSRWQVRVQQHFMGQSEVGPVPQRLHHWICPRIGGNGDKHNTNQTSLLASVLLASSVHDVTSPVRAAQPVRETRERVNAASVLTAQRDGPPGNVLLTFSDHLGGLHILFSSNGERWGRQEVGPM
ncbi:hypothetical protein AOLI_G00082040 [Acnodon oligacanthus]